jgi:hypothetical protein
MVEWMRNIRVLLDEITAKNVALHADLLNEIKTEFNHSIAPISLKIEFPEEFMCFEYALGLVNSLEYLGIRESEYRAGYFQPLGADNRFVTYMLEFGFLGEIAPSEAKEGDLIVYFDDDKPTHAGVVAKNGRVTSKWGRGILVEHELFEAPATYGSKVKYYGMVDIKCCEDAFIEYCESKGRTFTT